MNLNIVYYLAFEGRLPKEWVDVMNHQNVKVILTPSTYCAKCFIESGVTNVIKVLPHGVDPEQYNSSPTTCELDIFKKYKTVFLSAGTLHNKRKGFDLLIKAFCEEFKDDKDVALLLKLNKIYNKEDDLNKMVMEFVPDDFKDLDRIQIIDEDLTEPEMASLLKSADAFVSTSRSEGFGMMVLESMACGTPVIVTKGHSFVDFCNDKNALLIDVEKNLRWAQFVQPYQQAKWFEPKVDSIQKNMRLFVDNKSQYKLRAKDTSKQILKEYDWKNIANGLENIFRSLL